MQIKCTEMVYYVFTRHGLTKTYIPLRNRLSHTIKNKNVTEILFEVTMIILV